MILTLFTKLQSVTLEHPDRSEEVIFQLVVLGQIFAFFLMKIIDTITQHMQTRFLDLVKIRFLDLMDSSKYREYQKAFPEKSIKCLLDTFGFGFQFFFKNQLIFLYSLTEFQGKSPTQMLQFFSNNPASKAALSQVYLLCSLITVIHSDVGGGGGSLAPRLVLRCRSRFKM